MNFEFTEEQLMLQKMVRDFAGNEVAKHAYKIDKEESFPYEAWKKAGELGLLGITAPEEYGGSGLGIIETCIVAEELAAVCTSTCATIMHQSGLVIDNFMRHATEEQKEKYLPRLCSGELIGCLAMTEPNAGSDVLSMQMRAEKTEDGYILNGTKTFITNGPVADFALVYAKTSPEKGAKGISVFFIEDGTPGFKKGKKFEKMGWRGSPTGELIFENCFIPKENLVGEEDKGINILMAGLDSERVVMGVQGVGIATGALNASLKYAQEREQFGKSISKFQMIQDKFATMYTKIEAGRALAYKGASLIENEKTEGIARLAAATKLFGADVAMEVTTEAVQIFGGYGYMKEFPVERYMRDAKLMQIGGGTSEIQKHIIAKALLSN
ncbi:acyl-CoA dehydrogenase family protein [Viridibacillus sp. NPDC093762]|uniref:acyl-CoA dehydrogenase family protein n=1 Tax=Viridibacillus sp. NPDC093762 TaxID=3390720 RepID=UPI003D011A92